MKIFLLAALFSLHAHTESPQIKKTVDAVLGSWKGIMTAEIPGQPTESFPNEMNCHVIASGAGAECSSKADAPGMDLTQSCLLAFDPTSEFIHYMCVSSMGEVHDHRGKWESDSLIQYEPYEGGMTGAKITEYISTSFPDAKSMIHVSRIKMPDGSLMSFTFRATRQD